MASLAQPQTQGAKVGPCDVCGHLGFDNLIITCDQCNVAREHVYCMRNHSRDIPNYWCCEECIELGSIVKENFLDASASIPLQAPRQHDAGCRRPSKLALGSGWKVSKRQKTRYLSIEEVIGLPSGARKMDSPTPSKLGSNFGPSPKRTSTVPKPIHSKVFPPKNQVNSSFVGSKCTGSPKHNCALKGSITPKDALPLPEELIGGATLANVHPKSSIVKVKAVGDIYSRSKKDGGLLLAKDAIWKGRFTIADTFVHGDSCDALKAHLAAKVHCRAYDLSQQMAPTLQFMLFPRADLWSDIFPKYIPGREDIALYFFPQDERSRCFYATLLEFLKLHDFLMKTNMDSVELLLFSSERLRNECQRIGTEYFLWGLFRHVSKNVGSSYLNDDAEVDVVACADATPAVSVVDAIASAAFAEATAAVVVSDAGANKGDDQVVDMELDMIAGKNAGRVDIVVPKIPYNKGSGFCSRMDIPPPPGFEGRSPTDRKHKLKV